MKTLLNLSPALLGVLVVLQAGLNRRMAQHWNLSATTLLNALTLTLGAIVVFFLAGGHRGLPLKSFSPWFLVPGLMGLGIVLGGPWAVGRFGAVHTFILMIAAQLVASALWDLKIEGIALTTPRIAGIVLTGLGFFVANWTRSP